MNTDNFDVPVDEMKDNRNAAAIASEMIHMGARPCRERFTTVNPDQPIAFEQGDVEQRALMEENIISITHLTEHQIIDRLEQQRLNRLQKAGANLKCSIMLGKVGDAAQPGNTERCPKCTLPLPCQHFATLDDLFCFKKSGRIFQQFDWSMVEQKNRDQLILRKLQHERDGQFKESVISEPKTEDPQEDREKEVQQVPDIESREFQSTIDPYPKLDSPDELISDFLPQHLVSPKTAKHSTRSQFISLEPRDTHQSRRLMKGDKEVERMQKQQLVRKLRDDTFLRRLQLHTIKNQATSLGDSNKGPGHLTGKDRRLIERQIVEQKMEQVINTDRFADLAGLDERQLLEMLQREKIAEIRTTKQNYQPWEGMTHTSRKEFIERLLIQHKRRQLDDVESSYNINLSTAGSQSNRPRLGTQIMQRRNRAQYQQDRNSQKNRYNTISKF